MRKSKTELGSWFRKQVLATTIVATFLASLGEACLWDSETLFMERRRFPKAHELIVGHFVRHSSTYYKWRIEDRKSKAVEERTPLDYDDIAGAQDKLGLHDAAIETINEKLQRFPKQSVYESHANLGTFHVHAQRLEEGLTHISRAIEINPDAHFGREIYQKLAVEYILLKRKNDGNQLPLNPAQFGWQDGFCGFVLDKRSISSEQFDTEIQAAIKGVLGMMRFGNYGSPILLELLGDLLSYGNIREDAKNLAGRAYLKASYEVQAPASAKTYREKARHAVEMVEGYELEELEADLRKELSKAQIFFESIEADEKTWVEEGVDLDQRFADRYREIPALVVPEKKHFVNLLWGVGLSSLVGLICYRKWCSRERSPKE